MLYIGGVTMSVLPSPKELQEQLDRVVVLDARGFAAYEAAHIPGSFAIDMDAHMSGPLGVHGGRHPLPDMAVLAQRLSECGVTMDSHIVVYDAWISFAGRLRFLLLYMGFTNVKVLAGGIERWYREGYPLTQEETPTVADPKPLKYTLQDHLLMHRDEVLQASQTGSHVIIDARAPQRYDGSVVDTMDGMTGHIPGAINHFYEWGFTPDGVRPIAELEQAYGDLAKVEKPIVTYCGSGVTAANLMIALAEVGVEPAMYLGSSSDWVTYEGFPLETGVNTL